MTTSVDIKLPTPADIEIAQEALQILREIHISNEEITIRVSAADNSRKATIALPRAAFDLLLDTLGQLANGNAVTLMPVHAELTTQQAADLLNVSRPHLIGLLEKGVLPFHHVGTHRRIKCQDLLDFQQREQVRRRNILDELAVEAQKLDLGY